MSFNGSGTYIPPAGQPVATGTVIQSSTFNTLVTDIGNTLNNVLPRDGQASMSGQLKITDGTSGVPGIAFNSEASTGVYRPISGALALVAGGVENLRISSAGRVLIGTTADDGTNKLQVNGSVKITGALNLTGASTAASYTGPLTGNVIGNLTGNVTGNLTGNVTGNTSGTAANVTGVVAVANGGTGAVTAAAALAALGGLPLSGGVLTGTLALGNNQALQWKDTGGTARWVMSMDGSNNVDIVNAGGAQVRILNQAGGGNLLTVDNSGNTVLSGALTCSGGTMTGNVVFNNNTGLFFKDTSGTAHQTLIYSGDNNLYLNMPSGGHLNIDNTAGTAVIMSLDNAGNVTHSGSLTAAGGNFSAPVLFAEGTSSAPGISFNNDGAPDTGFYHINDGSFGITCNTNVTATFSSAVGTVFQRSVRANTGIYIGTNNATIYENGTNVIRLHSGAAGADHYLDFNTTGDLTGSGVSTGNLSGFRGLYLSDSTSTGGNASIGLTTNGAPNPSKTMRVGSGGNFEWINSAYSNVIAYLTDGGTFGAAVITQTSDERQKDNWQAVAPDFLTKLAAIEKVGMFDWIESKETSLGIGAQSLEAFLPAAVHTDDDGKKSVNYGGAAMVSVVELTKLVLELQARIAALEAA